MDAKETRNRIAVERVMFDGNTRTPADERSIADLFRELSADGRSLVRKEVELAKAELSEKVSVYTRNIGSMAVGGALLLVALMAIVTAVIYGMIVLFDLFLPFEVAVWLGPLVVGGVLALIGRSMIGKAKAKLAEETMVPQRTVETLRDDKDWLQSKVR